MLYAHTSHNGTDPQYLSDLLKHYTPARQLRSASNTQTFITPRVNTETFGERSFSYAGPSVWNNLPHSATLILPPLLKPPSRCTCLIIISKLFHSRAYPLVRCCVRACMHVSVSVVSVIVKCPVLPPHLVR